MAHRSLLDALGSVLNSSSQVYSGATLTFYSLADVLQEMYSDEDLGTPVTVAGVLTANSSGRFPVAYFDPSKDYKAVLKTSAGVTIATLNPIYKAAGYLTASDLTGYLQKSGGTMTGPINEAEGAAIASAASIDLDAATGNFVHVTGTTGISTITLAQGAQRDVIFDGALTLTHGASLLLGGANITTHANMLLRFRGEGSGVTRLVGGMTATGKAIRESAEIIVGIGDESTAITTGTAKITFRMPFAMTLDAIPRGSLTVAQSSGSLLTVDINESGNSILSTKMTFDNNETTTTTAATPCVLSDTSLAEDAAITIDVDTIGTSGAAGLKILLRGYRIAA